MTEKVEITAKFTSEGPNCRVPGECDDEGFCLEALALWKEINYRLHNREGDALDYQLKHSVCENPQALEMYGIGTRLTEQS